MIRLLLVSGSLRASSTNTAVLRTAQALVPDGAAAERYGGLADLPHFNQDDDAEPLPPEVALLRDALHAADGLLLSVPEYAGTLPGSFKNLLDWTIGDEQPRSILDKPVGWVNASPRGAAGAHAALRTVLGYAHAAIVEPACVHVPVTGAMVGADGLVADPDAREAIRVAVAALVAAAG